MPTLEEVQAKIKELDADIFGTKKEIKFLPQVLRSDEEIFGITSGFLNGNTWLITITNE